MYHSISILCKNRLKLIKGMNSPKFERVAEH